MYLGDAWLGAGSRAGLAWAPHGAGGAHWAGRGWSWSSQCPGSDGNCCWEVKEQPFVKSGGIMECHTGLSGKGPLRPSHYPKPPCPRLWQAGGPEGEWAGGSASAGTALSVPALLPGPLELGGRPGRRTHHICTGPAAGVRNSFSYGGKESEGFLQSVGVRNCIWQCGLLPQCSLQSCLQVISALMLALSMG